MSLDCARVLAVGGDTAAAGGGGRKVRPPAWLEPVAFGASRPSPVWRHELTPPIHRQASWRELLTHCPSWEALWSPDSGVLLLAEDEVGIIKLGLMPVQGGLESQAAGGPSAAAAGLMTSADFSLSSPALFLLEVGEMIFTVFIITGKGSQDWH